MAKTRSADAGNQEGEPTEDLAAQVAALQKQISVMMGIIADLTIARTTGQSSEERDDRNQGFRNEQQKQKQGTMTGAGEVQEEEEDEPPFASNLGLSGVARPFKVEAKIDIPSFDGTMDADQLDSWLDQLETYFSLYGYSSQEKVIFARLKLTHHALAWWNAHLRSGQQNISWTQFKGLLRQEFYPLGFEEDRWTRWHGLRQKNGQSVQDFTTEFRRMALTMRLSLEEISVNTKYVAGLHTYISDELRLFPVHSFGQASGMAMAIERKNQHQRGKTLAEQQNKNSGKKDNKWKGTIEQTSTTSSTTKTGLYCEHCKLSNHNKDKCWKLHPEQFPEKFKNQGDKGKRVAAVVEADADDTILSPLIEADPSLSLMVGKIKVPIQERDPREELFTLRAQVKKELVDVIIDPGSAANLISAELVHRLGLETFAHPRPRKLNWIQTETGVRVDQQCRLRFAINRDYIDEVVCDVVPLDVCQLLLGSPYLWDRDATFLRRAQQYRLIKDGVAYLVNRSKLKKTDSVVTAGQIARTMHSCSYVLLSQCQEKEENKREAEKNGLHSPQNSKTKELLKVPSQRIVSKKASQKSGTLQRTEVCHDEQAKFRQVPAQEKNLSVCTDGRLKTVSEEKQTTPTCIDGEWQIVSYKKKTKTSPTTQMVVEKNKKKNIAPTKGKGTLSSSPAKFTGVNLFFKKGACDPEFISDIWSSEFDCTRVQKVQKIYGEGGGSTQKSRGTSPAKYQKSLGGPFGKPKGYPSVFRRGTLRNSEGTPFGIRRGTPRISEGTPFGFPRVPPSESEGYPLGNQGYPRVPPHFGMVPKPVSPSR